MAAAAAATAAGLETGTLVLRPVSLGCYWGGGRLVGDAGMQLLVCWPSVTGHLHELFPAPGDRHQEVVSG